MIIQLLSTYLPLHFLHLSFEFKLPLYPVWLYDLCPVHTRFPPASPHFPQLTVVPQQTIYSLSDGFRFVTGESLRNVNCRLYAAWCQKLCTISVFQTREAPEEYKGPTSWLHACMPAFPQGRVGLRKAGAVLGAPSQGLAMPGEDHGVIRRPAVLCCSHSYLKTVQTSVAFADI